MPLRPRFSRISFSQPSAEQRQGNSDQRMEAARVRKCKPGCPWRQTPIAEHRAIDFGIDSIPGRIAVQYNLFDCHLAGGMHQHLSAQREQHARWMQRSVYLSTNGCLPVSCIPQACLAPGVTQAALASFTNFSKVPANDLISAEQALYNVLGVYFDGTPVASFFGGTPGAAPLNYLQIYSPDIQYATANANAPAQVVENGVTVSKRHKRSSIWRVRSSRKSQTTPFSLILRGDYPHRPAAPRDRSA